MWNNLPSWFYFFIFFFWVFCRVLPLIWHWRRTISFYQRRTFQTWYLLLSQVAINKYLQLCSFHVPQDQNGWHLSYSIKHKVRISVDKVLVLMWALVSHFLVTIVFLVFITCNNVEALYSSLKDCYRWCNIVFSSQVKAHAEP